MDDILDASSSFRDSLKLIESDVNLPRVFDHVIELTRVLTNPHVEIKCTYSKDLPSVRADEGRLKQVLHNLLGNASKYTDRGSITLGCHYEKKTECVVVLISDTGPGISKEDMEDIWAPYNMGRTSATTRRGKNKYFSFVLSSLFSPRKIVSRHFTK